ncbi:hypothetical protein SDC9_125600 [bioreactor metagenome]|uniref:Uncharacterized protein n=1 Tax=bioreactor metagenome TaxID=1076179 RepID=A0A645CNW3_9ZZZZ
MYPGADIHTRNIFFHNRRCNVSPPDGNVCLVRNDQVNVSVESRTGIPARLFFKIFEADCKHILLSIVVYKTGNIKIKRVVSVRPISSLFPVDVNSGIAHCPVELNFHPLVTGEIRNRESIPVPSDTGERKSARSSVMFGRFCLTVLDNSHPVDIVRPVKRAVNSPIVGHLHRLPRGIVEIYSRGRCVVFTRKLPAFF